MTTTATLPPAASSPAREGQTKRKTARPATSAKEALEIADRAILTAQAARARALARVQEEARQVRIAEGRGSVAALVERLDPTAREMVAAQLLGVARENEANNVQEWLASLAIKG